ncbi:urea transporter [Burkholderia plantarii]|uniref:urea transporter n=1 Tax=Burkholderia plantarii TaxID=41899 RepID=UPI0006D888D8|nr:urea transporter [Burkholderia plantarii]ALK33341.1 urea transporter [Burkholderia plantarii]
MLARRRLPPFALPPELLTLLRGVGQVVLQAHAGTGACVVAALALADPALACAALAGTAAATLAALLTSAPRGQGAAPSAPAPREAMPDAGTHATVHAGPRSPTHARIAVAGTAAPATAQAGLQRGLHGYSGTLAALAAVALIPDRSTAFAIALIAASVAGVLYRPVSRALARVGGAAYSLPAVLATLLWLPLVVPGTASLAAAPSDAPATLAGAALASFAQAVFASGRLPGAVLLAGLALASPRAAGLAVAGALLASVLLMAGGAHAGAAAGAAACAAGLLGYNGALAAIALAPAGARAALGAAALAAALHLLALHAGLPPLSAPFALAACLVSAVRRSRAPSHDEGVNGNADDAAGARLPAANGATHVVRPPR